MTAFGVLRRRQSVVWRTLLLFLFSQIVLAAPALLAVRAYWQDWQYEVDQRLYSGVTTDVARSIQKHLSPTVDLAEVRNKAHHFRSTYPHFDLFLLDKGGRVVANLSESENILETNQVSTGPLEEVLTARESAEYPIFAEDPHERSRVTIFSAARIQIEGQPGYVYATLVNRKTNRYEQIFTLASTLSAILVILPVFVLWCVPMGFICVYIYTRPLLNIAESIRAYEAGNLKQRIQLSSKDEFGEIAQAFNRMADGLARQFSSLQEKDRLRRELIADVSHDLHASLAGVSAVGERLRAQSETLDDTAREALVHVIEERTHAFQSLLSELFQLSRLEASDTTIKAKRSSMTLLLDELLLTYRMRCEARGIRISVEHPPDCPMVIADTALVTRALTNLLENALRYTPDGGSICLACYPKNGRLHVEVADSGSGISAEDLPKVFNRSFQSAQHGAGGKGLGGLGLAIVRKIAEVHGSTIEVQSESQKGTRFIFSLPIAPDSATPEEKIS